MSDRRSIPRYDARKQYMELLGESMKDIQVRMHRDMLEEVLHPLRNFFTLVRPSMDSESISECEQMEKRLTEMNEKMKSNPEIRKAYRDELIKFHRKIVDNVQPVLVPVTHVKSGESVDTDALMTESRS